MKIFKSLFNFLPLFPAEGARFYKIKFLFALGVYGGVTGFCAAIALILYFMTQVPDHRELMNYKPMLITKVYDMNGEVLAEYAKQRRIYVPIEDIPRDLVNAYLAAEDSDFYNHAGFDLKGIIRAALVNILTSRKQGASTITQQVAKTFLLTSERTYTRKIKELILARRIERTLEKDQILELYLNQIYLGHGAYGVAAAAMTYFNKDLDELDIGQRAILAGLPKAPSRYDPIRNPRQARFRRDVILVRMRDQGFITATQMTEAIERDLNLDPRPWLSGEDAPHFSEHVRRHIAEIYGNDTLYKEGLNVFTTLNRKYQKAAEEALYRGLREYDRRHGYRGPIGKVNLLIGWEGRMKQEGKDWASQRHIGEPAVVIELDEKEQRARIGLSNGDEGFIPLSAVKWARYYIDADTQGAKVDSVADVLKKGDIVMVKPLKEVYENYPEKKEEGAYSLEQIPTVQGALVALDNKTGAVRAMVGGLGSGTGFNRAVQAKRQSGSAFKPFVYALALENGYTPASIVLDAPVVLQTGEMDEKWKPHNYSEKIYGPSTLRRGLEKSRNLMTIRLAQQLGIKNIIGYARNYGLSSEMQPDLSTALGSSSFNLLELTSAYSVFPNAGRRAEPYFVESVSDAVGNNVYSHLSRCFNCMGEEATPNYVPDEMNVPTQEVTSPQVAYLMTSMLRGVVERGTAWRARHVGQPAGAKTGTTNDYIDAWLMGFTPELAIGVWVGFDKPQTMGRPETGSKAAAPIWSYFAKEAFKGQTPLNYEVPEGISFVRIDEASGKLPTPASKKKILEAFVEGTEPTESGTLDQENETSSVPSVESFGIY